MSTDDAAILHDAAVRLRDRADRALGDGVRWFTDDTDEFDRALWEETGHPDRCQPLLFAYDVPTDVFDLLATMTPEVAHLIADLLDQAHDVDLTWDNENVKAPALKLARVIGEHQ